MVNIINLIINCCYINKPLFIIDNKYIIVHMLIYLWIVRKKQEVGMELVKLVCLTKKRVSSFVITLRGINQTYCWSSDEANHTQKKKTKDNAKLKTDHIHNSYGHSLRLYRFKKHFKWLFKRCIDMKPCKTVSNIFTYFYL